MRKLITILFLVTLFPSATYLIVFQIQQIQVRHEIKRRIKAGVPKEELILLKIPRKLEENRNPLFERIDDNEFRYQGKMYDTVNKETKGDTTWYYCIADEKETKLFANLDELVKRTMNRNPQQRKQRVQLQHLLNSFFFNRQNDLHFAQPARELQSTQYRFGLKIWLSSPQIPPPKV